MHGRPGLTQQGLDILQYYVEQRNRELYWNYLAQQPGNDGYGQLALGVVRHDNMPGATANVYAQNYAREHHHKTFSEREWDNFGVDLIQRDFASRQKHMDEGKAEKALNLPGEDVQDAHKESFRNLGIDADAWTPNKLMNAARQKGESEALRSIAVIEEQGGHIPDPGAFTKQIVDEHVEKVWSSMLDNGGMGLPRAGQTIGSVMSANGIPFGDRATYLSDMTGAYLRASSERSHTDPHVIGNNEHYFVHKGEGDWSEVNYLRPDMGERIDSMHSIDVRTRTMLEDTHRLRHEREAAHDAFHPEDPGKHIPSPQPIASARPRSTLPMPGDDPIYAAIRSQLPIEVTDDKAAEAALQARRTGIHDADQLPPVDLDANDMIVCGWEHRRPMFELDAVTPAPPREESLELAIELDAWAAQMELAMPMQQQMQMDVQAMAQEGPSMSMGAS